MKTNLMRIYRSWIGILFVTGMLSLTAIAMADENRRASGVQVWQTNIVLPTYLAAPPSVVPRFYEGRTYQGAKATFYPYPVQDVLTDVKSNVTYKAVYLENPYIQISVLPELGGRIFSAVDKINGYDFFYRQHVIKPALIGMLGAWISGGVEWNVPHHHRATSFSPVDYTLQTNLDGSATIWVGEIELRHRMKWLVGMTLYPDRSDLELTCKVFNRTPFAHPMLFWINAAVAANTNYQVIFPPSTEWAAQHSKPEFASWPIAHQVYGGTDYTRGVDISWWKNHPNPVSFFAWNDQDDWFAGYDHGRKAGVVHVADHNVAPGKKFFEWGNGPEGETWSKILTDEDGPYLELMAGAWSDNQPDYSWIQPGETREWKHYWYPVRNMGGLKAANRDLAINLEVTNGVAKMVVNSTMLLTNVDVELMGLETNSFWSRNTNISPRNPFVASVNLTECGFPHDFQNRIGVRVGRFHSGEHHLDTLITYKSEEPKRCPMPKPVEKPKSPKDYASSDELYYTGQRVEQLYSPSFEAKPYYEEILRRDPGDYRANTAMGIMLCKQWRWDEASKYLSNAINRATANYIRPKDGEAFYYLGVALKEQTTNSYMFFNQYYALPKPIVDAWLSRLNEAEKAFHQGAWSAAWKSACFFQIAEIQCLRHEFQSALESINKCLESNEKHMPAIHLKSAILRALDRFDDAIICAKYAHSIDSLDVSSTIEQLLAGKKMNPATQPDSFTFDHWHDTALQQLTNFNNSTILEMIVNYANAGFFKEGGGVAWAMTSHSNYLDTFCDPVMHFYAGCFQTRSFTGHYDQLRQAIDSTWTDHFPFQYEAINLFQRVYSPYERTKGYYLLGNLLYDNQPERAIRFWETAIPRMGERIYYEPHPVDALILRNLSIGYAQHEKNLPKAIDSMEKAIALNTNEPRFYYELDVQYEANGESVTKRLAMLTNHHGIVLGRDDALTREIELLTVAGQSDRALELLRGRHFRNWEGSSQIHNVYVDACLAHGQQLASAQNYQAALKEFQAALEYPENLEVGKSRRSPRTAEIQYWIGIAYEGLGAKAEAKTAFEKSASGGRRDGYFQGLALTKLGRAKEAQTIFENLVKNGDDQLKKGEAPDYFAKFGQKQSERITQANACYLSGLGWLGQGKTKQAQDLFDKALKLHPAHLGATLQKTTTWKK